MLSYTRPNQKRSPVNDRASFGKNRSRRSATHEIPMPKSSCRGSPPAPVTIISGAPDATIGPPRVGRPHGRGTRSADIPRSPAASPSPLQSRPCRSPSSSPWSCRSRFVWVQRTQQGARRNKTERTGLKFVLTPAQWTGYRPQFSRHTHPAHDHPTPKATSMLSTPGRSLPEERM